MITTIENRLMTLTTVSLINRRKNPNFGGTGLFPAITIDYGYSADGKTPLSTQSDVIAIGIATLATDGATGATDIDTILDIDEQIAALIDGWGESASALRWRRRAGGNVDRETGYCVTSVRYSRETYREACEA